MKVQQTCMEAWSVIDPAGVGQIELDSHGLVALQQGMIYTGGHHRTLGDIEAMLESAMVDTAIPLTRVGFFRFFIGLAEQEWMWQAGLALAERRLTLHLQQATTHYNAPGPWSPERLNLLRALIDKLSQGIDKAQEGLREQCTPLDIDEAIAPWAQVAEFAETILHQM